MPAAQVKSKKRSGRTNASVEMMDWYVHIRSLGLSTVDEYKAWCRKHGFPFHRKKHWRQEREERQVADREQREAAIMGHIRTLSLESVEQYLAWCVEHDFPAVVEKNARQRQREWRLAADLRQGDEGANTLVEGVTPAHIKALGLDSEEEYKTWCAANKLSPSFAKGAAALRGEVALATLHTAKGQMNRLGPAIDQIWAGELEEAQLKSLVLRQIHRAFDKLDAQGQDRLKELLDHVVGCGAGLLANAWGASHWARRPGNTLVEGVLALAHFHRDWQRPVADWQPSSRDLQVQFSGLARHLFARFEVPAFMDEVWFRGDGVEARRCQGWFVHVGAGDNIRTADVPMELAKKMAHHFLQAPASCTVEQALRWGQVLGQGGGRELAQVIMNSRLAEFSADEPFWSSFLRFLVRQPQLDLKRIEGIIDYIHHRKFEPQADGLGGGQPPEPNFSMKSRSLPKLLRQVDKWQATWGRQALQPESRLDNKRRRKYGSYYFEETDPRTGRLLQWTVQELSTSRSLAAEGSIMRHCVASYTDKLGKTSIWSLQVKDGGRTRRILTIAIDNQNGTITEARGRFNADPGSEVGLRDVGGPSRSRSRLNGRYRELLSRSYDILQGWIERERIGYGQFENIQRLRATNTDEVDLPRADDVLGEEAQELGL